MQFEGAFNKGKNIAWIDLLFNVAVKEVSLTIPLSLRRTSASGTMEKNQRATEYFSFCQEATQKGCGGGPTILGFDWSLQENNLPKTTQVEFMHRFRLLYQLPAFHSELFHTTCTSVSCRSLSYTEVLTHSCPRLITKFHWPRASGFLFKGCKKTEHLSIRV